MTRLQRLVASLLVVAVVAAGCGDDDDASPDDTTTTSSSTSSTSSTTSSPTSSTTTTTTTTTTSTTTTLDPAPTSPLPDAELPGESIDISPGDGGLIAVVGVAHDDVLNVRRGPGVDFDIVATVDPTAEGVAATGRARNLASSIWYELTVEGGVVGWVNSQFTAKPGVTNDATSVVVSELGALPTAATMDALAEVVADALRGDSGVPSTVTVVVPASAGDLAEIVADLIGLGDDAVHGLRLHLFATGSPAAGFTLKSVEATDLCHAHRGPSGADGFCA